MEFVGLKKVLFVMVAIMDYQINAEKSVETEEPSIMISEMTEILSMEMAVGQIA